MGFISPDQARRLRADLGLSKARLAVRAGLNKNTLRFMDDPEWSPNVATLAALAELARVEGWTEDAA